VKVAHPDNEIARTRVQHEHEMILKMAKASIPVPAVSDDLLHDGQGHVYGYRMEVLYPIDFSQLLAIQPEVSAIVEHMHDQGYSHGDLSPSNLMRNEKAELVIIDPGYAGLLGTEIAAFIPRRQYNNLDVFDKSIDHLSIERWFK
jgi:tRNA A-37 threonylcarbamoyl transferase component Bud32